MSEQSLKDKTKKRYIGNLQSILLIKAFILLLVLLWHVCFRHQTMVYLHFLLFGMWGKIGINCFVLITGYYMCTSQITLRKFLKLLLQVEFYHIVIYAKFALTGYEQFSVKEAIKGLWPVQSVTGDFTSCFLLFYLTIPFMNILIKGMDGKMHLMLVLWLFFIFSFLASMPMITVDSNYVIWFSVLYLLASYVRLYQPRWIRHISHLGGTFVGYYLYVQCGRHALCEYSFRADNDMHSLRR